MAELKQELSLYLTFTGEVATQVKKDIDELGLTYPAIFLLGIEKAKEQRG